MLGRLKNCSTYSSAETDPVLLHRRLQDLVQLVPGVLFQYELSENGEHTISYVTDGLVDLAGVTPQSAISDPTALFGVIHPQDLERLLTSIKDSACNRTPWSREFRVISDGRIKWIEAEASVRESNRVFTYNGFARDITERKLLDLKLREAQEELLEMVEERTQNLAKTNSALKKLNKEIRDEISARIRLENKLRESYDLLSMLATDLVRSEERERRRIATELHDDVVQSLALGKLRIDMSAQKAAPPPDLMEALVSLIANAMQQIRRICNDLSPPVLYDFGLAEAIRSLGLRLGHEHDFAFDLKGDLSKNLLADQLRTVLYQTTRELLTNVVKHAKARNVRVQLRKRSNMAYLLVMDDGVGLGPSAGKGFGLSHVQQRVAFLKGTITFGSSPDWSTVVTVAVPLAE